LLERGLIVTADDFGAALEVNEAVETAHRRGVLDAASLMVAAPAADDAVARARDNPGLRVGLHIVLVDGRPALPPDQVPALVDAAGLFRRDMVWAALAMFARPDARRQLEAEITAQFEAFAATGLPLDHVNAHKHFHLHPTIAALVLEVGRRHGLRAIRLPLEPRRILALAEPQGVLRAEPVVDVWAGLARARFRRSGILAPDHVFGLRWSGAMTTARVAGLIRNLPPGLSEIYLHPAVRGGFEGAADGYLYEEEFAALIAPEVVMAASAPDLERGGFTDFSSAPQGASRLDDDRLDSAHLRL
jgi:hopanoid biosynthesis associated protein HpnK